MMKSKMIMAAAAVAAALFGNIHATEAKAPAEGKKMLMGYYPNWGQYSGFKADKIPFQYLTHLLYAFYVPDPGGNLANSDPTDEANLRNVIKIGHDKGVKILVSIGGASQSQNFPILAASASARTNFVKSCVKLATDLNLDGIDIDWEYPLENDGDNQLKLLRELKEALGKMPRKVLLTAAVPPTDYWAHWSKDESFQILDYVNIMTYDFMGTWEKNVIPNCSMDQTKQALEYFEKKRGVPRSRLVPGAAFYGKSFDGATGMGSTHNGKGSGNDGTWQWKDLLGQLQAAPYKVHWDPKTESEYAVGNEETIVFNGIPSQRVLGEYVRNSDLPGVMLWDLNGDVPETQKSLLVALFRGLRGTNHGPLVTPPTAP
jgi:GH18 family chitinase